MARVSKEKVIKEATTKEVQAEVVVKKEQLGIEEQPKKEETASTIKVKLSCRYGKNNPNDIVTLKAEQSKELLDLGVATEVKK